MTDEARLKRLTELAREVWPKEASFDIRNSGNGKAYVFDGNGFLCVGIGGHPRALDALEAALLVLADHERVPLTPDAVLRSKLQSAEQSRDKLRDAYAGLMLRLAKLAEKWLAEGAQAASLGGASDPVIRDVLRAAVWELREALKP